MMRKKKTSLLLKNQTILFCNHKGRKRLLYIGAMLIQVKVYNQRVSKKVFHYKDFVQMLWGEVTQFHFSWKQLSKTKCMKTL